MQLVPGSTQSEFLCSSCQGLLYVRASDGLEVCLNRSCAEWPSGYSGIVDPSEEAEPRIYEELTQQEERILEQIKGCSRAELRRFAYEERKALVQSLFENQVMPSLSRLFACGELLLLTQKLGHSRLHTLGWSDSTGFEGILGQIEGWANRLRFLEDLRTGRFVLLTLLDGSMSNDHFYIKYSVAVREAQLSMGIPSRSDDLQSESLFRYSDIEQKATPEPQPTSTDFGDYLETLWPTTLQFSYGLKSHDRTSAQYGYIPSLLDMAVLVGWYFSVWSEPAVCKIPATKETDEISKIGEHFAKYPELGRAAADFVTEYIDSDIKVPVVVRVPDGWLLDKWTLLFFILYLQGKPSLRTSSLPRFKEPLLVRMRSRAGHEFESWLRSEMNRAGFTGPDHAVQVGRFEYDILKISERAKSIILADAKYRDINPSSLTGQNLIQQELTGDHALLDESNRQQARLEYFRANPERFRRYLRPEGPWTAYQVSSFLVTKHVPILNGYKGTRVMRAAEFLESVASSPREKSPWGD